MVQTRRFPSKPQLPSAAAAIHLDEPGRDGSRSTRPLTLVAQLAAGTIAIGSLAAAAGIGGALLGSTEDITLRNSMLATNSTYDAAYVNGPRSALLEA